MTRLRQLRTLVLSALVALVATILGALVAAASMVLPR